MRDKRCGNWTLSASEPGGLLLVYDHNGVVQNRIQFFGNHVLDGLHDLKHLVDRAIETWEKL